MLKSLNRWIIALTITAPLPLHNGCAVVLVGAGAAIGAGTVAYVNGELQAAHEVGLDRAWNATIKTMNDMKCKITETDKDTLEGKMIARRPNDTKIVVKLKKQSEKVTEFRIRVGFFGDETLSRLIYSKIKKNF